MIIMWLRGAMVKKRLGDHDQYRGWRLAVLSVYAQDERELCQGVTKRCRLSWLTNSALVYEPKCGGKGGGVAGSPLCKWNKNKLWRSTSIFNLCCVYFRPAPLSSTYLRKTMLLLSLQYNVLAL